MSIEITCYRSGTNIIPHYWSGKFKPTNNINPHTWHQINSQIHARPPHPVAFLCQSGTPLDTREWALADRWRQTKHNYNRILIIACTQYSQSTWLWFRFNFGFYRCMYADMWARASGDARLYGPPDSGADGNDVLWKSTRDGWYVRVRECSSGTINRTFGLLGYCMCNYKKQF